LNSQSAALSEVMTSLRQRLMDDYYQHITVIEDLLKNGIKKGLFRDLPSQEMAEALFYLIRASAIAWMLNPKKESLLSKRAFIIDIFLHGVQKI
jgi:hypothetical protein